MSITVKEICRKMKLADEVSSEILSFDEQLDFSEVRGICSRMSDPEYWKTGLQELQEYCGDDPRGMRILTVYIRALIGTYEEYEKRGIPENIFWDTMGFIPRFIESEKKTFGEYKFTKAWWFPRELTMREFRVGEYEYEYVTEGGVKKINIHIPSDADLENGDIEAIYPFTQQFYPEFADSDIYCDSWLMSQALKKLLPGNSGIRKFQDHFTIIDADEESSCFMEWVYERSDYTYEELPEKTSLQRNMKKFLLSGGKVGTAYGKYSKRQ